MDPIPGMLIDPSGLRSVLSPDILVSHAVTFLEALGMKMVHSHGW